MEKDKEEKPVARPNPRCPHCKGSGVVEYEAPIASQFYTCECNGESARFLTTNPDRVWRMV